VVDIPDPQPGLVIRFSYLWRDEHDKGQDEGSKDRPCAIILAVMEASGRKRVAVAPITHATPELNSGAILIPPATARRLGLDDLPQWIVTREINLFTWPGGDIRPVPGKAPSTIAYGHLPHALATQVIEGVRHHVRSRSSQAVERDEQPVLRGKPSPGESDRD
jgi:hypothetical protein